MSSFIRRTTAASVLILSAVLAVSVQAGASPAASPGEPTPAASPHPSPGTSPTAAQVGAGWLGHQFKGRPFIRSNGKPDPGSTAEAILALAAAGVGATQAGAAVTWLESNFESYVSPSGTDPAGALATVILAAQAMGVDPTTFGGTGTANDLVTRLEDRNRRRDRTPACRLVQSHLQRCLPPGPGPHGPGQPGDRQRHHGGRRQLAQEPAVQRRWLGGLPVGHRPRSSLRRARPGHLHRTGHQLDLPGRRGPGGGGSHFRRQPHHLLRVGARMPTAASATSVLPASHPIPTRRARSSRPSSPWAGWARAPSPSPGEPRPCRPWPVFNSGCSVPKAHRGAYLFPPGKHPDLLATIQAVPGAAEVAFPLTARTLASGLPRPTCPAH